MSNEGQTVKTDYDIAHAGDPASAQDKRDARAYRDLMDDVDSSRFEANDSALASLREGLNGKLGESVGTYDPNALDKDTAKAISEARNLVAGAFDTASAAGVKVTSYLRNNSIFPGEKRERVGPMIDDAVSTMDANTRIARATLDATEAELHAATRPVVPDGEALTAREDARLLLDSAKNGPEIMGRVQAYVRDNDDSVAGLLCDPAWMGRYLIGRGVDPTLIDAYGATIAADVAKRAETSADNRRRASAKAIHHVRNIRAAIDVVTQARSRIDPRKR